MLPAVGAVESNHSTGQSPVKPNGVIMMDQTSDESEKNSESFSKLSQPTPPLLL